MSVMNKICFEKGVWKFKSSILQIFYKIAPNLLNNTCAGVSFFNKRLPHSGFPVNFSGPPMLYENSEKLQAWVNCALDADWARLGPRTDWGNLPGAHILSCKTEKKTDLQISSRIDKIIKKIMWIANAIRKTSVLVILW